MDIEPRSTALLCVHLQHDVVRPEGAFGGFFGEMVEKTGVVDRAAGMIDAARSSGAPVFYTRICFSEGHPELIANAPLFEVVGQARCLVDGTEGAAIVPEVAPGEEDVIVDHVRATGTWGTDLVEQLHSRGIENVAVMGVATNISVEGTARDLMDAGFDVYVVADCCTAATREAHDASIETLGLMTRGIVSSEELKDALGSGVSA